MNLEIENQIVELMEIYYPNSDYTMRNASLLGMCKAMLTDEQGEKMISYLQKWISEAK